jgi:hypothetical protein
MRMWQALRSCVADMCECLLQLINVFCAAGNRIEALAHVIER